MEIRRRRRRRRRRGEEEQQLVVVGHFSIREIFGGSFRFFWKKIERAQGDMRIQTEQAFGLFWGTSFHHLVSQAKMTGGWQLKSPTDKSDESTQPRFSTFRLQQRRSIHCFYITIFGSELQNLKFRFWVKATQHNTFISRTKFPFL